MGMHWPKPPAARYAAARARLPKRRLDRLWVGSHDMTQGTPYKQVNEDGVGRKGCQTIFV